jgi:hypothetical protein
MDQTADLGNRGPVSIGRPGRIIVLVWSALIVELGILAIAVGWAPGSPVSRILEALLWPGSLVAFVALGALPRRGGLLLGLAGGLLVGLTCAIVVSVLPETLLPLDPATPANRVFTIIQAVWATPIVGMALGAVGIGLRQVLVSRVLGLARGTRDAAPARVRAESWGGGESVPDGDEHRFAPSNPGQAPVGLAIAAGAAVSLAVASASSELRPAPR